MFYTNYVRLCNSVNKSPSAVALEIGTTKATVSRWKAGGKPNYASAQKIADYFGVDVTELLNGTPEKEIPAATKSDRDDKNYKKLLTFIASSTEEELQQLLEYSDFIKSKRPK